MNNLLTLFVPVDSLKWIVLLIVIDVVLGIVAALIKKDFRLGKLAKFMVKPVLGYILGFAVLGMVVEVLPNFGWFLNISFVLIVLALIGSILNNLAKIGIKLPPYLLRD